MDKWLHALQKAVPATALGPASGPATDALLSAILDDAGGRPENCETDMSHPVSDFVSKTEFNRFAKTDGIANEFWDAPLAKTVPASASQQRFQKALDKLFANHPEEREQALAIARTMIDEERAEVIAAAAA